MGSEFLFRYLYCFFFFILLWFILHKTILGRYIYALGGNEIASYIAGVKNNTVKIFVYAISGILSTLASMILISRLISAQPTLGTGFELEAIAAVVIGGTTLSGGRGKIVGTLLGILIIGVLNNSLNLTRGIFFLSASSKRICYTSCGIIRYKKSIAEFILIDMYIFLWYY